jgi:hypothetical protein
MALVVIIVGAYLAVSGVVALADELRLVHASGRRYPQASGQLAFVLGKQLARSYQPTAHTHQ